MSNIRDLSDEELMTLYQSGDYTAFECLYERHSARVFQYLKAKVALEAARDLVQETFLKVHRSRAQYQPQYPFLPWLFTVARNSLNDFLKSPERRMIKTEFNAETLPGALLPVVSDHDLSVALQGLTHVQRRAIELRYMNEWTFEKIAAEMNTTPENSRQIISRGVKKIRSFFKGEKK